MRYLRYSNNLHPVSQARKSSNLIFIATGALLF